MTIKSVSLAQSIIVIQLSLILPGVVVDNLSDILEGLAVWIGQLTFIIGIALFAYNIKRE